MNDRIVLVGFEDQNNLGMGYLSAVLRSNGFVVSMLDIKCGVESLVKRIREEEPLIIGFSIIFQFAIDIFSVLAARVRQESVRGTICAGGHFPSLRPAETFEAIPELDFIVLFEGEETLLEVACKLRDGLNFGDVEGVAYRREGKVESSSLRKLISDLDTLPFPDRSEKNFLCLGVPSASILASRGCLWNCSFCSIRKYYEAPPGPLRRIRSAKNVVDEMETIYREKGTRIFLFQDDDFAMRSISDRRWIKMFIEELDRRKLENSFLWKVSCRTDEVDKHLLEEMKRVGLYLVYLGIESGNESGLKVLNKHLSIEANTNAVKQIRELELLFDFGFMLIDPSSTLDLIRENVDFLMNICDGGYSPISFSKMLPYAGTTIENELLKEGRLIGDVKNPDYTYLDSRVGSFYHFIHIVFTGWMAGEPSLLDILHWGQLETVVARKFFPKAYHIDLYSRQVSYLISLANKTFATIIDEGLSFFESDPVLNFDEIMTVLALETSQIRKDILTRLYQARILFLWSNPDIQASTQEI